MNKLIFPILLCTIGCIFPAKYGNPFDQKSTGGLFLGAFFNSSPFSCANHSNNKSLGSVDQVLLQCNRDLANIDAEYLAKSNQDIFSNISFAKIDSDRLLVKFDPLTDDGQYELILSGVVSNAGETLTDDKLPIIVDTKIPTVSLVGYIPITDYTFFSAHYWDFTTSEPLANFGQPILSGSLAPSVILRSVQKINETTYRVYFEVNFSSNSPGSLTLQFSNSKDNASNEVSNSLTVQFIGLVPGPNLHHGRSEFDAFQNANGDIIAIYGFASSAEILRKGSSSFILTNPSLPTISRGERGVMLDGKNLLITGGIQAPGPYALTSSYIFDTETTTFTPTGSMNGPRHLHNIVKLQDGKVIVLGGIREYELDPMTPLAFFSLNTAEIYDPATGTFTELTNKMMTPRSFSCSVLLDDGRVFVIGGTDGIFAPKDTTEFYDPITQTFSWGPTLPVPVGALKCMKLVDGNVLIYGAQLSNLNNSTMLYDRTRNQILTVANSKFRREWSIASELPDGGVLFYGGGYRYNTSEPSRVMEKLDYAKSNNFFDMGMAKYSVTKHSGVKFSDGTLFFLGGEIGGMFHLETEYYGLSH
ncbi:Kelch repeat-containing protein [Leptospira vanthielii]|uniref:Galactose oxidase, central domain protein n=1 Tax=Leptospira vanthielii serovar Holland str. Waz Holland = ATCC 700522 TaxID=1218591 RepID=N1W2X0_9LEPT|nr:kelch repeat-containing protein [Leptospira vanthielii]EMY70559.1 galactose oxidase, central domain protein [Leptospira vanthielii serovar Holland str. Waz Holland = ATCC 700522]